MKKSLAKFLLSVASIALFSLVLPTALPVNSAQAACETGYEAQGPLCVPKTGITGGFASEKTVGGFMLRLVQVLLVLSAVVAILFIIIGGFRYMTSSGNQEAADKGKKQITNAVIGLVVIILSYTIVSVLINTIITGKVIGTGGGGGGNTVCPSGQSPLPDGSCPR